MIPGAPWMTTRAVVAETGADPAVIVSKVPPKKPGARAPSPARRPCQAESGPARAPALPRIFMVRGAPQAHGDCELGCAAVRRSGERGTAAGRKGRRQAPPLRRAGKTGVSQGAGFVRPRSSQRHRVQRGSLDDEREVARVKDAGRGRSKAGPEASSGRGFLARLVTPLAAPATDAERARTVVGTFVLHLRPVRVPAAAIRFTHTFGLGGMSLVLLSLLVVTGSLLMLAYTPAPGEAYASIERSRPRCRSAPSCARSTAGAATRRGARRSSTCCASSSPAAPRDARGTGSSASSCCCGRLFQLHRLSPAVGSARLLGGHDRHRHARYVPVAGAALQQLLRGGPESARARSTFFSCTRGGCRRALAPPARTSGWSGRPAGSWCRPPWTSSGSPRVGDFPAAPAEARSDRCARGHRRGGWCGAGRQRAARNRANPGLSPNPAKAPWYFMGVQELLVHLHPFFAVLVVPLAAARSLACLPALRRRTSRAGRGSARRRAADGGARRRRGRALVGDRTRCSWTTDRGRRRAARR